MDDDENHESEDDALEDARAGNTFHPDTDEEKLAEDNDPPFSPPSGSDAGIPPDDPETDDRLDEDEVYDGGLDEATNRDDIQEDSDDAPPKPLDPDAA